MYIEVMYSMTSQCRFLRHSAYVPYSLHVVNDQCFVSVGFGQQ